MNKQIGFNLAVAMVVAMAAGACGTAPSAPMSAMPESKASKVKKTPTVHVIDAGTLVGATADQATMKLEFNVMTEGRQLLAVDAAPAVAPIPDIFDRVEFIVTCESLPKPLTATVTRAQFLNGKAVIQFNNLPAGKLTVSAIAKDKAGNKLIEANGSGVVKLGELTIVKMTCVVPPKAGVGHARIELDCFNEDCMSGPAPTPSAFVPFPVQKVTFRSLGDPHEEGANNLKFENQLTGTFLALKTLTNDFKLVKHQMPAAMKAWAGTTVNVAVGIQSGKDTFLYYLSNHRARLNNAKVPMTTGQTMTAPGGMKITRGAAMVGRTVFTVTTPQGDLVTIEDHGYFLNVLGHIGAERVVHEVRGELGTFNNGTPKEGMLMRDGATAPNLAAFLNEWRADWSENLFVGEEPIVATNADNLPLPATKATN